LHTSVRRTVSECPWPESADAYEERGFTLQYRLSRTSEPEEIAHWADYPLIREVTSAVWISDRDTELDAAPGAKEGLIWARAIRLQMLRRS
jgi:hypothetical protein